MRHASFLIAFTLLVGVPGLSSASAKPEVDAVEVRITGDYVNFRRVIPASLPDYRRNRIRRHFERVETLYASYRQMGPSPTGEVAVWYFVSNRATGEWGWVFSAYVQAIDPIDTEKLQSLPLIGEPVRPIRDAIEGIEHNYHLGFWATLFGATVAFVGMVVAIIKFLRRRSTWNVPQPQDLSNVVAFQRPQSEPDILFGMANGQVWVHRRART